MWNLDLKTWKLVSLGTLALIASSIPALDSIGRDNMAAGIVTTLKTKIKENAEDLEKYEILAEETRKKVTSEKKLRDEAENEVSAMQRKIKLLEDNIERNQDRLEIITRNLQNTTESLETSDDGRQAIESKYETTADKIESLEKQVAEAKKIAEESDQKCEEIVRKLVLSEHNKDRAEDRASRCDDKIKGLEEELNYIGKSMQSLSVNGDKSAEKEDNNEDQIRELKQRFSAAEVSAETADRAVQRLQKELDVLQDGMLKEKTKKKRMEEDMDSLMTSINNI